MTRKVSPRKKGNHRSRLFAHGVIILLVCGVGIPEIEATEYFVAIDHPDASDANDGLSLEQPFRTLGRGTLSLSPGDTLTVQEGIYREKLQVAVDGTVSDPVVVRAYPGDDGRVVIRGSDVVSGWSSEGGNIWSVPWGPLPLIDYPSGYPYVDEYARRREMVFIDGNQFQQVISAADLIEGSFWMDDAAQRLRICFMGDLNNSQVEISVRELGVQARGRSHLVFRGLRVEHVSTDIWISAMTLGPYCRVEDCNVEHNNGHGIGVDSSSVILRTTSNHNGRLGVGLSGSDSLFDSSETSYNSWRYPHWACGGIKLVSVGTASGNRFVRHTAKFNDGAGIFLDTVGSGNVIEASIFEGNSTSGIKIEAAIGPNLVLNNLIVNMDNNADGFPGIRLLVARDTYIYNNTIVNDGGNCILINGSERVSNGYHYYAANTRVFNNILNVDPGPRAIGLGVSGLSGSPSNLASHRFDNNLYFGADPMMWWQGPFTLAEWQATRGEDLDSFSASPMFSNPAVGDYSLQSVSPAIDAGLDFPEVTEDILGTTRSLGLSDLGAYEWADGASIFGGDFETGDLSNWELGS